MNKTFEDFLMEKHADQYVGTDDMMPDDYEDWIQGLGSDDFIEYAEMWMEEFCKNVIKNLKGEV